MLGIALFSQITVSIVTQGVPTLAPFLQEDLQLTRGEVGLFNSAITGGSFVALFVAGWIVDIKGERAALTWGNVIVGIACITIVFAHTFVAALGVFFIAGIGAAFSTPAGGRTVMRWFSAARRGTAMGVRQTGIPIGGALAAAALPVIAIAAGWRIAIVVCGVLCLVAAAVSLSAYHTEAGEALPRASGFPRISFREVVNRDIALMGLAGSLLPMGQFALVTYLALYLKETQSIPVTTSALMLVGAQIAGAAGRVLWGVWSDRFFHARRKPALITANVIAAVFSIGIGWLAPGVPVWLIALIVLIYAFSTIGWHGTWMSIVAEIAGPEKQGRTIAAAMTIMYAGIISLPPLFGVFVDYTHSWRWAWTLLGGFLLVGTALVVPVTEARKPHPQG
jgi:MFS family permease